MEPIEIHEAGLLLRPWRPDDVDAVFEACQDPAIPRWTSLPSPYRREDAETFVTTYAEQAWAAGNGAPFGVFDPGTGGLLGSCGLSWLNPNERLAELVYWTAPWARQRGVATRAARAVARWALDTLGVRRLMWRAEVGNHASRWVAETIGVRVEGVARASERRGDAWVDMWTGALLAGELLEAPTTVRHLKVFGGPQPRLTARTPAGTTITLRAPRGDDVPAIVEACRDPESVRWTTVPDPYGVDDALAFVHSFTGARWRAGTGAIYVIVGPDDAYAGSMDIDIIAPGTADVGFLMAPHARGQGYASTALRALCDWAFDALAVDRVEWRAYVGNQASRRTAIRAGFTVEGTARAACVQRGVRRDAWIGARLVSDPPPDHTVRENDRPEEPADVHL